MNQEQVLQQFSGLSPDRQQEVLDFIAFLQTRPVPPSADKASKRKNLTSEPFVGLWRERKDLRNSSDWVRKNRREEWKESRG